MSTIIGLIFDFDITLSPEFQQQVLFDAWGVDATTFWGECKTLIDAGYDMEHAYMRNLIDYGRKNPFYALSNAMLETFGHQVDLYEGLSRQNGQKSIFDDIYTLLHQPKFAKHGIQCECYCISGGLKPMIEGVLEAHGLSGYFKEVFACDFDNDSSGKLGYIKETVGHTIKTQKLFMIAKGISPRQGDHPTRVNDIPHTYRIPFEQMIFVGDEQTDIPEFALVNKKRGKITCGGGKAGIATPSCGLFQWKTAENGVIGVCGEYCNPYCKSALSVKMSRGRYDLAFLG